MNKLNHTDMEILQRDIRELYLGNLNTVEFDLTLPEAGEHGSAISWESGNGKLISDTGKVSRPVYGNGNREVELFATFRYGSAEERKTYKVTILEQKNIIKAVKIYPMELAAEIDKRLYLPNVTVIDTEDARTITHPVLWDNGGSVLYHEEGKYQVHGLLTGTDIPITAQVAVFREIPEYRISNMPQVTAFEDGEVALTGKSPFLSARDNTYEYLITVDDDQMLYNFREAAGLDTLGAPEMNGWDSPDCNLRGHTTGHYLSSLALCYRDNKDHIIRNKALYLVEALAQCQAAFSKQEGFHPGFLSAYSEEQFDLLEQYTRYPLIWAPYYTLHKIMAGLLDCYLLIGIDQALEVLTGLGDWVYNRLTALTHEQRSRMWSLYIAGEFGGMNEVLASLYQITGKDRYLEAARLFDNDRLLYPMRIGVDALNELHANQHIPQVIGSMKIFQVTGDKYYYDIARFFWKTVTKAHCYVIGGTGEAEMFHEPDRIAGLLSQNTAETCASYNMLKLTKELYCYRPDSTYMDYYDRTMTNHILATCGHHRDGAAIYFLPLAPGYSKEFHTENTCCHGTGLENHFRYVESIYYHSEREIYVNQFIPSRLDWRDRDIRIDLLTEEEKPGMIRMKVEGNTELLIKVRVPYWCEGSYRVIMNNEAVNPVREEKQYLILDRFSGKDIIEITWQCSLRIEKAPDEEDIITVFYGPYVLAAITEDKRFVRLNLEGRPLGEVLVQQENTLEFRHIDSSLLFKPLYRVADEKYQVYVKY